MENIIRKREQRKGTALQPVPEHVDKFEELNRHLQKPRLRQEECPNSIAWWGVSGVCYIGLIILIFLFSINLRILSPVY